MAAEVVDEQEEKSGFFSWLKSKFSKEEEEEEETPQYERKLLDGRIEKYLDQNFDSYIKEYGILDGLDLESYESRYKKMTGRVSSMKEFVVEADANLSHLEKDLDEVKKASKKKKK
mgnify:FL=1